MNKIDNILMSRGERYGNFRDLADIVQKLKKCMRSHHGWEALTSSQKEALESIAMKIGRMLAGDPTYIDNPTDIVGYATLMLQDMDNYDPNL